MTRHVAQVLRHLRELVQSANAPALPDAELLKRFVGTQAEEPFALLVERHGPMILGVCRRILQNSHDADDAFQATFLVLARRAAAMRRPESLAAWLHGIALRLALNMKRQASKRREREKQAVPRPAETPVDLGVRELHAALDEELQRLPEQNRQPLLLCYLQGLTQEEAAQQLALPRGTLKRRLERGRDLLKCRLTKRGLTLGAALIATAPASEALAAPLPATLAIATIKAGALVAAGKAAAASMVSARVASLAEGVVKAMFLAKLGKLTTVLVFGIVCCGLGFAGYAHMASDQPAGTGLVEQQDKQAGNTPGDKAKLMGEPADAINSKPAEDGVAGGPKAAETDKKKAGKDKERNPYKALPPEILKAWTDAGARAFAQDMAVRMPDIYFGFVGEIDFITQKPFGPGLLSKLPDPGKPFGLILHGKWVTDAVLKELAPFKNLQLLKLTSQEVTDAGLKALAPLANLQTLAVRGTKVTGTGLKYLTGLKDLQNLYLGNEVTDAGLAELAELPNLKWLDLTQSNITDVRLKKLAGLKNLQALVLKSAYQVTDAGLKPLAELNSLQTLWLSNTQVTDVGLKKLAGLKALQSLDLDSTQVTDAGLKELAGLKNLEQLRLGHTKVTDVGLKELAGLKRLQLLILTNTKVTDAGVAELAGLKDLQCLYLDGTPITDGGLKHLAGLKNLQSLNVFGTKATSAGIAMLQKELPECRIERSGTRR